MGWQASKRGGIIKKAVMEPSVQNQFLAIDCLCDMRILHADAHVEAARVLRIEPVGYGYAGYDVFGGDWCGGWARRTPVGTPGGVGGGGSVGVGSGVEGGIQG